MGCSIKFVRLDDFIADIDYIDLSADGYSLANDGYSQVVAPIGARSVYEVITLHLQGTSKDDLALMVQDIDEKIKQVQWWLENSGVEKYQVWIRVQLDGETYSRQAQILNIKPSDRVRVFTPMEIRDNYIGEYSIGVERTPFWEGGSTGPVTKTAIDIGGGTSALSAAVAGDVPARLVKFSLYPNSSSSLDNISSAWVGFKTSRFGTAANFVPRWGLNSGFYGTDTSASADATAYSGYKITTTFGTDATMVQRSLTYAAFVSPSNSSDQRGTYLVLMRAKMSDNTSISRAKIAYSFSGYFPVFRSPQTISGTEWALFEMGSVKNPPSRSYNYHNLGTFRIAVYADRVTGSGGLLCDSLILIPIDDGAIKVVSPISISGAGSGQRFTVFQWADDKVTGLVESAVTGIDYTTLVSPQNRWSLPTDNTAPVVVVAANDITIGNTKNRAVSFAYTYITRWRTMRGGTA